MKKICLLSALCLILSGICIACDSSEKVTEAHTVETTDTNTDNDATTESESTSGEEGTVTPSEDSDSHATEVESTESEIETDSETEAETETETERTVAIDVYESLTKEKLKISNGKTMNYRLYVPQNYNPKKSYPVLIFLHGSGERGNDNTSQLKHVVQGLFNNLSSPVYDAIVICPQCPAGTRWVNVDPGYGDYRLEDTTESNEIKGVLEILSHIQGNH